jgi:DNA modification methylase
MSDLAILPDDDEKSLTVLQPDPHNARHHGERNQAVIRQSLEEVGPFRSIAVDGDGIIRAGNGVYEQAQKLGLKVRIVQASADELIAVQRPDLRGELAEKAALLDNRSGELAEWDVQELLRLQEQSPEIIGEMWEDKEWRLLLNQLNDQKPETEGLPEPKPELANDLRAQWGVEPGQIWLIPSISTTGCSHRLMCGDSTKPEDVRRLMAGQRAVLFATDPPYLVDYTGTNHSKATGNKDWSDLYHDWDNSEQGVALYDGFIETAIAEAITEDAAWYCWHASRRQAMLEDCWMRHGAFVHQQIIWVKDRPTLTRSWFLWAHEPCFMGWIKGKKPRKATDEILRSVWELKVPDGDEHVEHPTQKPLEVFIYPMQQHTYPGELVYEPFSGSGSQLVAAETAGRLCNAMEISPQFVAVALQRLADLGLKPELE